MNLELLKYIEEYILPIYNKNDLGHSKDHIEYVINRSLMFAKSLNVDLNMVYTIASYHDCGHSIDPKNHEVISANILFNDINLIKFFNKEQILIMYEAIEDHRSKLDIEPRSIYGKIVSSADRSTSVDSTLSRVYEYIVKNSPNLNIDEIIKEAKKHIIDKFGVNGYAREKMYFKDLEYEKYLKNINDLVNNNDEFIRRFKLINNII